MTKNISAPNLKYWMCQIFKIRKKMRLNYPKIFSEKCFTSNIYENPENK